MEKREEKLFKALQSPSGPSVMVKKPMVKQTAGCTAVISEIFFNFLKRR